MALTNWQKYKIDNNIDYGEVKSPEERAYQDELEKEKKRQRIIQQHRAIFDDLNRDAQRKYAQYQKEQRIHDREAGLNMNQIEGVLSGTNTPTSLKKAEERLNNIEPKYRGLIYAETQKEHNASSDKMDDFVGTNELIERLGLDYRLTKERENELYSSGRREAVEKEREAIRERYNNYNQLYKDAKALSDYYQEVQSKPKDQLQHRLDPAQQLVYSEYKLGERKDIYDALEAGDDDNALMQKFSLDKQEAKDYRDAFARIKNYEHQAELREDVNINKDKGALSTIGKTAANHITSYAGFVAGGYASAGANATSRARNTIADYVNEKAGKTVIARDNMGYDVYAPSSNLANRGRYAHSEIKEKTLNDNKIAARVYDAIDSTGKSLSLMGISLGVDYVTGGAAIPVTAAQMGVLTTYAASTYDDTYYDARQRGLSVEQSNKLAQTSAAIETATEVISLDKVSKIAKGTEKELKLWKVALSSGGIEVSEELAAASLNRYYERQQIGDTGLSQQEMTIAEYMKQGYTREEAEHMERKDFAEEIAWLIPTTFVSGVASANMAASIGRISPDIERRSIRKAYRTEAQENTGETRADQIAKEQAERYAKNPLRAQVDLMDESTEESKARKTRALEIAEKYDNGKRISTSDSFEVNKLLAEDKNAGTYGKYTRYLSEIQDDDSILSNISEKEARVALNEAAENADVERMADVLERMRNSTSQYVRENADQIFDEYVGKAENNGVTAEQIEGARVSIREAQEAGYNGEQMENLSSNAQEAYNKKAIERIEEQGDLVNEYAEDLNDKRAAKVFKEALPENININQYQDAFKRIYHLAEQGAKFKSIQNNPSVILLGEETAHMIHEAGNITYNNALKARRLEVTNQKLGIKKGAGLFQNNTTENVGTFAGEVIARVSGLNVNIEESLEHNAKAEFVPSLSTINIAKGQYEALSHELLGEFTEFYASKEYKKACDAALELARSQMTEKEFEAWAEDVYHREYSEVQEGQTRYDSSREMANDVIAALMTEEAAQDKFANKLIEKYGAIEGEHIMQKFYHYYKKFLNSLKRMFANANLNTFQRKALNAELDKKAAVVDKFMVAFDEAVKNYQTLQEGKEVTTTDGTTRLSIATYEDGGRAKLETYLREKSGLSKMDQLDALEQLDDAYKYIKSIMDPLDAGYELAKEMRDSKKFESFANWSNTKLVLAPDGTPLLNVYNADGRPVKSVVVNNGEYPLNIDFSQVCKKREALDTVLNKLVADTDFNLNMLTESDINDINTLIKDNNFEIACGLCFVDSKRYRVGEWSNSFVEGKFDKNGRKYQKGWNDLVKSILPDGVKAEYFNFATTHEKPIGTLLSEIPEDQLNWQTIDKILDGYVKEDGTLGQRIRNGKKQNPTELVRMAYLIKTDANSRMLLDAHDIEASKGLGKLREENQNLYRIVNIHWGSGKPKLSHGYTAYGNDILESVNWGKKNDFNPDNAWSVGGVRVQSFSDYVANMFFDYMQMFADMTARELPSHAYTKEVNYVKIFGLTGQKINMSGVPMAAKLTEEQQKRYNELAGNGKKINIARILKDPEFAALAKHAGLDENGNYLWEFETFPMDEAFKLRKAEGYKNFCGIIVVGVSDAHILKLLADPEIDMVIPYHSSGVSPLIKKARNIALYTDYTNVQNTRDQNGKAIKNDHFDWYGLLKSEHNPNGLEAKEVAEEYKKYCEENGYTPKFDKFKDDPNYYKLLIDFRAYDDEGNFQPQQAVKAQYPGDLKDIVKASLKEHQDTKSRLDAALTDEQNSLYNEIKDMLRRKGTLIDNPKSFSLDLSDTLSDEDFIDDLLDDIDIEEIEEWNTVDELMEKLRKNIEEAPAKERKKAIRHLTRSALGDGFKTEGKKVAFTDDRIESYLRQFAASNEKYAQAYITYMSPADFILLTANGEKGSQTFDRLMAESHEFNEEEFKDSIKYQPIFLDIDEANKITKVYGHEGRHRMIALQMAGYTQVPVLLFNYDNKYSKEYIPSMRLKPQDFSGKSNYNKSNEITLTDIEPLSRGNIENVKAKFGSGANADVSFSLNLDSEGRTLAEEQKEYFKNTKAVDENGNLKVFYHGARGAGFTIFNPAYSDDQRSLFFTDKNTVAKTYSGTSELFEPDKTYSFKELAKIVDSASYGDNELIQDGDTYKLLDWDETVLAEGSLKEVQNIFIDSLQDIHSDSDANYKVYLNITNPLIVDAKGNNWDELGQLRSKDIKSKIEYATVYNELGNGQWEIEYSEWGELKTEVFNEEELNKKFGKTSAMLLKEGREVNDLLFDADGKMIPNNTRQYSEYAKNNGYDGVILNNIIDIGLYAGGAERFMQSQVVVAFDSNQVKSVHNINPTENDDIRYSLQFDQDWMDLMEESNPTMNDKSILEEGLKALKGKQVDTKAVNKIASELKNEFASTIDRKEFADMLSRAFAYLHTQDNIKFNDVMAIFEEVAKPVIDSATKVENKEIYDEFTEYFKNHKIKLSDKQLAEIRSVYGSYDAYKAAMRPLQFSLNGDMMLDEVWMNLAESYPALISYDVTDLDMPMALNDTLEAIKPSPTNTFGADTEEVGKDLAMRVVEEYLGMQSDAKLKKAAEQMKAAEKQYRADVRKRYQDRLAKSRENVKEAVYNERWKDAERRTKEQKQFAEILAKSKDRMTQYKDRQNAKHEKQQIAKIVTDISNRIMTPTENKHVPHEMVEPLMQFLSVFDFSEPTVRFDEKEGLYKITMLDYHGKGSELNHRYTLTGNSVSEVLQKFHEELNEGKGSQNARSWQERMRAMTELFAQSGAQEQEMSDVLNMLDPSMSDQLKEILNNNNDKLSVNNLSTKDLTTIKDALRNIRKAINDQNKAFTMKQDIPDTAHDILQNARDMKDKQYTKPYQDFHKMMVMNMMTPETFFSLLGEKGRAIYTSYETAFDKKIELIHKAHNFTQELFKDVDTKGWTGRNAQIYTFETSEGEIKMTTAQIMSLYESRKRQQAMFHKVGGFEVESFTTGIAKRIINQNRGMHLTETELDDICNTLTEEQIKIADELQQFMANECGAWGNEASMMMYDFEKFLDPNYFPITTDKNSNKADNVESKSNLLNGIERSSFTNAVVKNASNPIVIKDIFDVFTKHVVDMAAYRAYAPAIKDTLRIYNYKDVIDNGNIKDYETVKWAIDKSMGRADNAGTKYLEQWIRDINGAERLREITVLDGFANNYKAAAVGANLRVVLQQPTAYTRAAVLIDPKYLIEASPSVAKAFTNIAKLREENELVFWKSQGYFEANVGRSEKTIITGFETPREYLTDLSMKMAGWADDITWSTLYEASKKQTKAENPGLSEEELKTKTDELFREVIHQTQVVDSTIMKSPWQRSQSAANKLMSPFMAEPIKSYNVALKAFLQYARSSDKSKAGKTLARAVAALAVTDVFTSIAQSLMDALRHKDDDDDDYWKLVLEYFWKNMIDNANMIKRVPFLKDAWDMSVDTIKKAIEGKSTYGSNNTGKLMEYQVVESLLGSVNTTIRLVNGTYNKTPYAAYMDYAKAISQMSGVPLYNVSRDFSAFYNLLVPSNLELKKDVADANDSLKKVFEAIDEERDPEYIEKKYKEALEENKTINEWDTYFKNKYKDPYLDALEQGNEKEAEDIYEKAVRAYMLDGLSRAEAEEEVESWSDIKIGYGDLDKAIASGDGIELATKIVMENKDTDKIIEHIYNSYAKTIDHNRKKGYQSDIEANVNKVLKQLAGIDYDTMAAEQEQILSERAEKAEQTAIRQENKQKLFDAIDNGTDYKTVIQEMVKNGSEFKAIKSAITKQYKEEFISAYRSGNRQKASQIKQRVATVNAYCDQQSGLNIPTNYNGNYYQYEFDHVDEWLK